MPTLYLHTHNTLADWEPCHVLAELRSGRYLKDPSLRYEVVLCGLTPDPVTTMGGLHLKPDVLASDIRPESGDIVILPGADTWLDPAQAPVIAKVRELLEQGTVIAAICGATLDAWHGLFATRKPEYFYALMQSLHRPPGAH